MKFYDRVATNAAAANGLGNITWSVARAQHALPPTAVNETVVYTVSDVGGAGWETGRAQLTESGGTYTITRGGAQTVTASSNAGAAVTLTNSSLHSVILAHDAQHIGLTAGSIQLIQTETASSTAEFVFILPASGYDSFELVFKDVESSIDNGSLAMQVSVDGGATWASGSSDYHYGAWRATSLNTRESKGFTILYIPLSGGLGIQAGETANGFVRVLSQGTATSRASFSIFAVTRDSTDVTLLTDAGVQYDTVGDTVNALRVHMYAGTIAAGTFSLYGRVTE